MNKKSLHVPQNNVKATVNKYCQLCDMILQDNSNFEFLFGCILWFNDTSAQKNWNNNYSVKSVKKNNLSMLG